MLLLCVTEMDRARGQPRRREKTMRLLSGERTSLGMGADTDEARFCKENAHGLRSYRKSGCHHGGQQWRR